MRRYAVNSFISFASVLGAVVIWRQATGESAGSSLGGIGFCALAPMVAFAAIELYQLMHRPAVDEAADDHS